MEFSSNEDPVAELLQFNTSKLFTQDMKHGGTPLHWSSSREVLLELIDRGCDVNAVNFEERTALHVMVERNRLECVVALLSHEADIDVRDKDGNTPLHLAIQKKLVPIVQCLVVFGCDFDLKNRDDQTPRHLVGKEASGSADDMILYILHSVGAKRCVLWFLQHYENIYKFVRLRCRCTNKSCPSGCNPNETYNGIPPAQPESAENREHIYQVLASTSRPQRSGSLMNNLVQLSNNSATTLTSPVDPAGSRNKDTVPSTTLVDVTQEQKGRNVMDALLGMFAKVNAHAMPKTGNPEEDEQKEEAYKSRFKEVLLTQECFSIWSDGMLDEVTAEFMDADTVVEDGASSGEPFSIPVSTKGGRLLCMDGGGIRGLILVQLLLEIEKLSQTPVHHMFDWVAGTSTGGILALGLGSGKTMRQCMCMYLRMKDQAFVGSRPYASDNLEALLKESLGEYSVMTDIKHPKIMVTGVMADRKPVDLHLFRNYTCASDILGIVTPTSKSF